MAAPPRTVGYVPTYINEAIQVIYFVPPNDTFYMDIGATFHVTNSQGTLSSYFHLIKNNNNSIIIGKGSMILVCGYGTESLNETTPSTPLPK